MATTLDSVLEQARALEAKGDLSGAIGALQQASEVMQARGLWRYARGALALRQGDLEAALSNLEKAVEAEPEVPEYRSNLGAVWLERARRGEAGASAKALEVLEAAVRWGPTLPDVFSNYALALQLAGRNELALKACDDALAIDPAHLGARFNRAAVLNAMGRHAEAKDALDAVLSQHPGHPAASAARAKVVERLSRA
jgi:tetratricopeptide (TPR) repeat protein